MEMFLVYLWSIWGNFNWIGWSLSLILLGSAIFAILMLVEKDDSAPFWVNIFKKTGIATFVFWFLVSLTPTKNQMVLIFSAPNIVKLAKSIKDSNTTKKLSNTPKKLVYLLNNSLDFLNKKVKETK